MFDLSTLKRAGSRRVRTAKDLVSFLHDPNEAEEVRELFTQDTLPPIAGGAANALQVISNPAALAAAQATVIGPLIGIPQDPLVLSYWYIPTIAGVSAASTMIFQTRRTDTPAVIQSGTILTGTAQTQVGAITQVGIVPFGIPAASGVDCQANTSAGAGTITVSATSPMILAVLGVQ